jgi:hypothetical protein
MALLLRGLIMVREQQQLLLLLLLLEQNLLLLLLELNVILEELDGVAYEHRLLQQLLIQPELLELLVGHFEQVLLDLTLL